MKQIELPKDALGRVISLDTEVMYDINGKKVRITSFTYRCDVHGLRSQWKVFSQDITCEEYGMLPADSLYLTPPDSWEKLEEDVGRVVENKDAFYTTACAYMNQGGDTCNDCRLYGHNTSNCTDKMFKDVVSRIRKLRSED